MATTGKPPGWRQGTMGELVAEFIGTAIIILFGCGSVAMTVAALNQSDRGKEALVASGDWLLITTGWGVGVALAVWVAGGVSGAHLSPAVTLAQALRRVPIVGPMVGGALGAYLYDLLIRDMLIARGATPDPEIAEEGDTAIDEPRGAPA